MIKQWQYTKSDETPYSPFYKRLGGDIPVGAFHYAVTPFFPLLSPLRRIAANKGSHDHYAPNTKKPLASGLMSKAGNSGFFSRLAIVILLRPRHARIVACK